MNTHPPAYIGRFAPSPTGELHQGSLLTAAASYLDARAHDGRWLVRMEDLDPPREQPGAADSILRTLEAHALHWDDAVLYQSTRADAYEAALETLRQQGLVYPCQCNRQRLKSLHGYDGWCKQHPPTQREVALRLTVPETDTIRFDDLWQGTQIHILSEEGGDFVIKRKDGLYAYQLAVSVDDLAQGITHVIRGSDLLDSTPRQIYLLRCLGGQPPCYGHLPVIVNRDGQKLSKQTFAPALDNQQASANLYRVLCQLHQQPPAELAGAPCSTLLDWATSHWQRESIPPGLQIPTQG